VLHLESNYWADGVDVCNARLFQRDSRGGEVVLATMTFPAA
jgi:hypothetical protein